VTNSVSRIGQRTGGNRRDPSGPDRRPPGPAERLNPVRQLVLCTVLVATSPVLAQDRPLPDQAAFLQEARQRLQTDEARQSDYVYVETRRDLKLDKAGHPAGETVNVYESYPGLPDEPRWRRQIAKDGKPLPAAELAKKDRQREEHALKYARRLERQTDADRAEEARRREKKRRENEADVDDTFRIYEFRMLGRETIGGHETIGFSFAPRPGVTPRTRDGKILRNFTGKAWVSESDYELVRLEVEAINTVSFGLGMLARVHKGSRLAFERRKVNGEVWLPASASYTVSGRFLLLKRLRVGAVSEFSDYRKYTVATETSVIPPG